MNGVPMYCHSCDVEWQASRSEESVCAHCGYNGAFIGTEFKPCLLCGHIQTKSVPCQKCNGTGEVDRDQEGVAGLRACLECQGVGKIVWCEKCNPPRVN